MANNKSLESNSELLIFQQKICLVSPQPPFSQQQVLILNQKFTLCHAKLTVYLRNVKLYQSCPTCEYAHSDLSITKLYYAYAKLFII